MLIAKKSRLRILIKKASLFHQKVGERRKESVQGTLHRLLPFNELFCSPTSGSLCGEQDELGHYLIIQGAQYIRRV